MVYGSLMDGVWIVNGWCMDGVCMVVPACVPPEVRRVVREVRGGRVTVRVRVRVRVTGHTHITHRHSRTHTRMYTPGRHMQHTHTHTHAHTHLHTYLRTHMYTLTAHHTRTHTHTHLSTTSTHTHTHTALPVRSDLSDSVHPLGALLLVGRTQLPLEVIAHSLRRCAHQSGVCANQVCAPIRRALGLDRG